MTQPRNSEIVPIPAGRVEIGDNAGPPDEHPAFPYTLHSFLIDRTPVTVAQFAAFVKDAHYKTDAERYGSAGVLNKEQGAWVAVRGATWRHPTGPKERAALGNHPVAPLDNTLVERALKKAILHRKNALYFKTENGARVGDLFMSLIHTCELNGVASLGYLIALQKHAREVAEQPAAWMPWNYRDTLAQAEQGSPSV